MSAQKFELEVIPTIPKVLSRLTELANNLWYTWDTLTRTLFERLDSDLWTRVGQNPKLFLRCIEQQRLHKAAADPLFLETYYQVLSSYDHYHQSHERREVGRQLEENDLIAYFCAEYGFHESLAVYSGGLGVLSGDFCKTASDLRLPCVGIGLYYHQGYFYQLINAEGHQIMTTHVPEPRHSPMSPVIDKSGAEIHIVVTIADRSVHVKAWKVQIGHILLYLLDTHVGQNSPEDRVLTHQLYGGDEEMRIKQAIILGVGGVRMLRQLGLLPTVWHLNEKHATFCILERLREQVIEGQPFEQALEVVAANTVFTTHTSPSSAGHDHFPQNLVLHYLGDFIHDLKLTTETFFSLGCLPNDGLDFSMTTLAITGSRHINGVSRIHGQVIADAYAKYWPQMMPIENPVRYVTNGVHVPTFLAREWSDLFDKFIGGEWRNHLCDVKFWQRIEKIPEQLFWNVKQIIKSQMLITVRNALIMQHSRNQISETHLERILRFVDPKNPNILTIGFARRFATYKRATLLFNDINWLRRILNNPDRPVVFIFAGKAHPSDVLGQELIKTIHHYSHEPDFIGKILLIQGYNLGLARHLVAGVDVWLNTPIYPMEASGTSGMKAAINGAINLSVPDGWWAEGYDGYNGWSIKPASQSDDVTLRDQKDARTLYEILEDDVIPLYYDRDKYSYSLAWVNKAKRSMMTVLPQFNTVRLLNDYLEKFYLPASRQIRLLTANHYAKAKLLTEWKDKIRIAWGGVKIRQLVAPIQQLSYGESVTIQVALFLNGLHPADVTVDLLLSRKQYQPEVPIRESGSALQKLWHENDIPTIHHRFVAERPLPDTQEYLYSLAFQPEWCGGLSYHIRVFPFHELLTSPYEMGMMVWA
ncbi:MAG: alpha-glucan phosphorylase [Beggiatoa sp. IS2]|nr:MAG: alpha-glucan phosphorylase [Beggiatoa sp. IS2]